MPSFKNEQDEFFFQLDQKKKQDPKKYSILTETIKTAEGKTDVFYLCQKYANITRNSYKFKDGSAYFQESDIREAIEATKQFCKNYKISDYNLLLEIIYQLHPLAADRTDGSSGGIIIDGTDRSGGLSGSYYNFSKIPENIWESIKSDVITVLTKE